MKLFKPMTDAHLGRPGERLGEGLRFVGGAGQWPPRVAGTKPAQQYMRGSGRTCEWEPHLGTALHVVCHGCLHKTASFPFPE